MGKQPGDNPFNCSGFGGCSSSATIIATQLVPDQRRDAIHVASFKPLVAAYEQERCDGHDRHDQNGQDNGGRRRWKGR
jgi:hypothetical protein